MNAHFPPFDELDSPEAHEDNLRRFLDDPETHDGLRLRESLEALLRHNSQRER